MQNLLVQREKETEKLSVGGGGLWSSELAAKGFEIKAAKDAGGGWGLEFGTEHVAREKTVAMRQAE